MEPWQRAYRHGTLVIWPPDLVRESVNRWREQFDPVSHRCVEAHITLTQPFKERVTEDVLDQVTVALRTEDAFEITYGPLRSFLPSPVLWLEVQPSQRVVDLRRRLHSIGVFDLSLPHTDDFVPHMTITEGLSGSRVNDSLFESLRPRIQGGTFDCQSVAYLLPDDEFRFHVQREIRLRDAEQADGAGV